MLAATVILFADRNSQSNFSAFETFSQTKAKSFHDRHNFVGLDIIGNKGIGLLNFAA